MVLKSWVYQTADHLGLDTFLPHHSNRPLESVNNLAKPHDKDFNEIKHFFFPALSFPLTIWQIFPKSLFFCILRNYLQNRSLCKTSEEPSDSPSPFTPSWLSILLGTGPHCGEMLLLSMSGSYYQGHWPLAVHWFPVAVHLEWDRSHIFIRGSSRALDVLFRLSSPLILSSPRPSLPPFCCALFCIIGNCSTRHLRRGPPHTEAPRMRELCLISPTYSHHCVLKWSTALEELARMRVGLRSRGFVNAILLLSDVSWPANLFYRALQLEKCSS